MKLVVTCIALPLTLLATAHYLQLQQLFFFQIILHKPIFPVPERAMVPDIIMLVSNKTLLISIVAAKHCQLWSPTKSKIRDFILNLAPGVWILRLFLPRLTAAV